MQFLTQKSKNLCEVPQDYVKLQKADQEEERRLGLVEPVFDNLHTIENIDRKEKKVKQTSQKGLAPKERKTLQRVNPEIAKKLIEFFNKEQKMPNSLIALRVGLSNRAVYRVKNQYYETGNIQATEKRKISVKTSQKHNTIIQLAKQRLLGNPYQTMSDLCRELQKEGINVSRLVFTFNCYSVVYCYIFIYQCVQIQLVQRSNGQSSLNNSVKDFKEITLYIQKLTYIPYSRNNDTVMRQRLQYCKQLQSLKDQNLYFTDETSFNLKTAPHYGWALKGKEVSLKIADHAGQTISVMAIISIKGLVNFRIIKGTARAQNVQSNFKDNALPYIGDDDILIMDNVRSHRSQEITNFIRATNLKVKYLPPYSPQLNPIENLFGTIKARFRRLRVQKEVKNTTQLIEVVKQVFEQQFSQSLENYYRKMREYVELGAQNLPFQKNL